MCDCWKACLQPTRVRVIGAICFVGSNNNYNLKATTSHIMGHGVKLAQHSDYSETEGDTGNLVRKVWFLSVCLSLFDCLRNLCGAEKTKACD